MAWRVAALALWGLIACGSKDPVRELIRDLDRYPEYSLIVDDTRIEDSSFFPDYFLRFQVLTAAGQRVAGRDTIAYEERRTDWMEVKEETFYRYEKYVGMVVSSKSLDGRRTGTSQAHPPGYQYVGNSQYGFWGGGGFWQFYGQYALMSSLMGGWNVGRGDWEDYRRNRGRGRPYYGPTKGGQPTFGSRGSQTQKTRPQFYQRQQSRRQAFSGQVKNRMGRTTSGWGRGSSRFGK